MKTIYLVTGSQGAYDDHTAWLVCAYTHKHHAERRVKELNTLARQFEAEQDEAAKLNLADRYNAKYRPALRLARHERGDPNAQVLGNGSLYYDFEELALFDEEPS